MILGVILLAYAENRFDEVSPEIEAKASARFPSTTANYKAGPVCYLPEAADLGVSVKARQVFKLTRPTCLIRSPQPSGASSRSHVQPRPTCRP